MSAYGKAHLPQLHGYDSSRAYPEAPFQYETSGQETSTPVYQQAPQLIVPYTSSQGRSYEDSAGPYLNVGSSQMPQVTSYSPSRGSRNTKVYVYISSLYDLISTAAPFFFVVFGNGKCPAVVHRTDQQGTLYQYSITVDAPQFSTTGSASSTVSLSLFMENGDGDLIGKVDVGEFTFLDGTQSIETSPQDLSRKRKVSIGSAELLKSPAKRTSSQSLRPKEEYPNGYGYTADVPTYAPYMPSTNSYGNLANHQYARPPSNYQRHLAYGYSNSGAASPPALKAHSPQVGAWGTYGSVGSNISRDGLASNVGLPRPSLSSLPSPAISANPPLIRTSTLQQTPSPAATPHGHPGQLFNAYALYPHKAKLEINGDLDSMAQQWSDDECETRRRLVHFRRSQSGSTITISFQTIVAEDRPKLPPAEITISCIYWEEKQQCFVTSVDTISLLEFIVNVKFTVEEKNRIRRNLEGFRPLTVSKGKPDSEEFFKVIMAFPAPKPRNIEKDVKVFHWKDLGAALKKILGKYSASPSSVQPPTLLTPVSSTGYATEGSSAGMSYSEHHGAVSPRSISGSTTSTAYTSNIPARVLSPHNQKSLGLQNGPSDLRVSLPHNPHEASGHWHGGQHHMQNSQSYQHSQLGNPNHRNSWDMSTYLDSNSATAGGTSGNSQTLNYTSARPTSDSVTSGADNRMARSLSSQQQSQQMPRS